MSWLWQMVRPHRGGSDGSPPLSATGWRATVVGLHSFSALILSLALVTAVVGGPGGGYQQWTIGALTVLALGYVVLGAPAISGSADRRAVAYLVVLVVTVGVVSWSDARLLFLLTLAYPQVWFLVERARTGLLWTLLLATTSTVGLSISVVRGGDSALPAVGDMSVGLVFSVLMGFWMSRVFEQSRQRAQLIHDVESAREQLAVAHHNEGVTAERERLAREVHDTLAQGYTSIVVLAQTARAELSTDPGRVCDRLHLIEDVARDNLAEARAVVAAFAPVALDASTLAEALHRLGERFSRETGTPVHVRIDVPVGSAQLLRADEIVLLRTAQEALANARRHARASQVILSLHRERGDMVVSVTDDGVGFDPDHAAGTGLTGLRNRVEQAGGDFALQSQPGQGTRLAARLPLEADAR